MYFLVENWSRSIEIINQMFTYCIYRYVFYDIILLSL